MSLSRRSFIKASVVAGVVAGAGSFNPPMKALAVDSSQSETSGETIVRGTCRPNCENLCNINLHVRDGKVVRTSVAHMADTRYDRICIRGLTHVERIYDPDRLKYPMKRVEGTPRGGGQWERITWDEAISTITGKWKELQEKYGNQSIISLHVSANYAVVNGAAGFITRLFNAMQASEMISLIDCNMVYGFLTTIGSRCMFWQATEPAEMVGAARNVIVWATNITETHPHNWHFITEAQDEGAKIIVIDPKFTTAASKADQYIPIRPGSDSAMVLAMIKIIIDNEWMDTPYVKAHTVAPFLVKASDGKFLRCSDVPGLSSADADDYVVWDVATNSAAPSKSAIDPELLGSFTIEGNAVSTALVLLKDRVAPYTLEKAEELTTVKASVIEEFARTYALEGPSFIYPLFGQDRYYGGHQFAHSLATLAGLTGNIGKAGASVGVNTFWGLLSPDSYFDERTTSGIPNVLVPEVVRTGEYLGMEWPIKATYSYCCNPIGNLQGQNQWLEIFDNMELNVVADVRMTDTAAYADIVLPVAGWFEVEDVATYGNHPHIMYQQKAIEPPYECKSDSDIARLLADAMGLSEVVQLTDEEFIKNTLAASTATLGDEVTWERLKSEQVMRFDSNPVIYGENGQFNTPSGRVEFYLENPSPFVPLGQAVDEGDDLETERLPQFLPPMEAWFENPLYDKYPLVMLPSHDKWRAHTQWSHVPILRELDPEPVVHISPQDAESRNIEHGSVVKIFNDRGSVVLTAVINNGVQPGVVYVPRGWQRDQHLSGGYQELSQPGYNPMSYNTLFSDTLVQIEIA